MTEIILKVSVWGEDVAAVVWDKEREYAVFEFFSEFSAKGLDMAPLIMPLEDIRRGVRTYYFPSHRNNKTFKGLPGLIADSLPDAYGDQILEEYFVGKGLNVSEFSPVDRLCYVGKRGMGALEFEPAQRNLQLDESSIIEIARLTDIAKEALGKREEFQLKSDEGDESLLDIIRVGTSAGGAKPKAIIAVNGDMSEVRSGQVKAPDGFTYWLLKFDGVEAGRVTNNPLGIGRIEYAYYKMALDCGIEMTECRLFEEGQYAHFMTKRFDRTDAGDKLHTQTLCAIAHFDRDALHSYEQAFQVMRRMNLSYPDMEQLYRRMVFNIIARNHDDHTKNHSFILSRGGEWSLAPAYDFATPILRRADGLTGIRCLQITSVTISGGKTCWM
ncbi:MAG: type II toxin-antitoxin system HipA family toxin [Tannerellaceae bacterium]|jgi:serine/threonine-protein kinase HipA|nr:type II toxin-antitoxin system HipA family toxin [Tannerellaceae bacterium]